MSVAAANPLLRPRMSHSTEYPERIQAVPTNWTPLKVTLAETNPANKSFYTPGAKACGGSSRIQKNRLR
jgi:hypothetical protein